jgi:hypothetical protein
LWHDKDPWSKEEIVSASKKFNVSISRYKRMSLQITKCLGLNPLHVLGPLPGRQCVIMKFLETKCVSFTNYKTNVLEYMG